LALGDPLGEPYPKFARCAIDQLPQTSIINFSSC
jgi:hypothetical protein